MLNLNKLDGKRRKSIKATQQANTANMWLNHKGRSITNQQIDFLNIVWETIGGYTNIDLEIFNNDFCIYIVVNEQQRRIIDQAFSKTTDIAIDNPIDNYINVIRITFKLKV